MFPRRIHVVNSPAMSSLVVVTRLRECSGLSLELKSVMITCSPSNVLTPRDYVYHSLLLTLKRSLCGTSRKQTRITS